MARKKFLMGNWKMNHTIAEAVQFCEDVKNDSLLKLARSKGVLLGVAPSFLSLNQVKRHAHGLIVASQDCHYEESGAYTSCVSANMLSEIGISWSIIGHSERRTYDNDTSFVCNRKIHTLLKHKFHVIYCVGETLKEYEQGLTKDVVKEQILVGLMNISKDDIANIVIAYEPVWSIGTGKNASAEIAQDVCSYIRSLLEELYGKVMASKILILYGGSVKPNNVHDYLLQEDVDGALVGGASLKSESFKELLENI